MTFKRPVIVGYVAVDGGSEDVPELLLALLTGSIAPRYWALLYR